MSEKDPLRYYLLAHRRTPVGQTHTISSGVGDGGGVVSWQLASSLRVGGVDSNLERLFETDCGSRIFQSSSPSSRLQFHMSAKPANGVGWPVAAGLSRALRRDKARGV